MTDTSFAPCDTSKSNQESMKEKIGEIGPLMIAKTIQGRQWLVQHGGQKIGTLSLVNLRGLLDSDCLDGLLSEWLELNGVPALPLTLARGAANSSARCDHAGQGSFLFIFAITVANNSGRVRQAQGCKRKIRGKTGVRDDMGT
jgi:hypothetical protein